MRGQNRNDGQACKAKKPLQDVQRNSAGEAGQFDRR